MPVLWLCGVHHHAQRCSLAGHRCRLHLPKVLWLERVLEEGGIDAKWNMREGEGGLHPFAILGLIQVGAGDAYDGPLCAWPRENRVQHEYYKFPLDAFSVRVAAVFKLAEPLRIFQKLGQRGQVSRIQGGDGLFLPCGMSYQSVGERQGEELHRGGPLACSARDLLAGWGCDPRGMGSLRAIMLAQPLAELVMKRRWEHIVVLYRWLHSADLFDGFPPFPPRAVRRRSGEHDVALEPTVFSLRPFENLIDDLRRWAPRILAPIDNDDDEWLAGERLRLERHVRWAQESMLRFHPLVGHAPSSTPGDGRVYSSQQLVSAVICAWHLRDNVGLPHVLPHAIDSIMPAWLPHSLLAAGFAMAPSRSTMRLAQLAVDMAWMLVRRDSVSGQRRALRFGWADSSTVAQSDWFISKHQVVARADCLEAARASQELARNLHEGLPDIEHRRALSRRVFDAVRILTHVPQNLGLGATGLEQKVAALLYCFYLEVGSFGLLSEFLNSFVSFTTDMGTEMGAASFLVKDIRQLLPAWLRDPCFVNDVAGEEDAAPLGHAGDPIPFMPQAVIVPGGLHICSNLSKDITEQLSHWDAFYKSLKTFEALLSVRDRRERFVGKCVGNHDDARLFRNFSGSLYEKRWGVVVGFLQKLKPLLEPLRLHWSAEAWSRHYVERDAAAQEGQQFSPAELTTALNSSLFMAYVNMTLTIFETLDNLSSWLEGCSCHEHLLKARTGYLSRRSLEREIGVPLADCPMKGKRAPECASGFLDRVFDEMWESAKALLLGDWPAMALTEAEESVLLSDFQAGRSYLQLGAQIKFDFWGRLPWKLAGLAHHDVLVSRRIARESLVAFDEFAGEDPTYVHHYLTIRLLGRGSELRAEVGVYLSSRCLNCKPGVVAVPRSQATRLGFTIGRPSCTLDAVDVPRLQAARFGFALCARRCASSSNG